MELCAFVRVDVIKGRCILSSQQTPLQCCK